eukprot:TRINITY_DN5690_c0_g1_i1.p1 TRINITY_DN5690_c0_g1~~TRINITY_DN5690_c0_g1_i1.p1  ORF type:complete len:112 (-),score=10.24 TRINITY_DN5690_c0_g1_i1:25-360(-)
MTQKYIIALDQGTTSCRTVILNKEEKIIAKTQQEFQQIFPQPGWVEHDANEILQTQLKTLQQAIEQAQISPSQIAGIGITNQRETTVVWNKSTGKPIYLSLIHISEPTRPY